MTFWQNARRAIDRAKDEAGGAARSARIHIDLRELKGARDHMFQRIGRRVYTAHTESGGTGGVEGLFGEVARLEALIREKEAELAAVRERTEAPG